ncbi:hypothetical protein Nepgr_007150 [Nepenthes gracilis]|uniref:RING-type domain-containing protein n=1 Tax=Nepenthes gracilis TaxID=150966 RepID=A0AAD3XI36_NEPGR|nr:hypothetical protein Nepgr_007150 [Nepenthes gracilis]
MIEWSFASLDTFVICRNAVYWWGCLQSGGYGVEFGVKLLKRAAFAAGTCVFAFGGALVGGIAGAMEGQTTETGFFRGGAIGVISGAIVALELLDSTINGHFLSKVALASSILNGKAFREWVSPAVLEAYQWQISVVEGQENEVTGIYDVAETRGMLVELIKRLPMIYFYHNQMPTSPNAVCCAICLQDLVDGESARILPSCEHLFHLNCIDEWLVRCASCPVCRQLVGSEE